MFARIGNLRFLTKSTHFTTKKFYSTELGHNKHSCKLLVVGGGTGGCAVAAKFSKVLKKHELIIVDPSEYHYYQPLFTLVGGGIEKLEEARRKQENVLPSNATWIKDSAVEYDVKKQTVRTQKGHTIEYDYLLVAVGLELRFDKIPGLLDALEKKNTGVCSNYSPKYVVNTFPTMQSISSGNAIFTFPNSPVKCPGAPQKICYITDHYLRKEGKRNNVNVMYNTSLPVIFGVKKYADALWKVCKERNITVNLRTNLIEVKMDKKIAVFENLDTKLKTEIPYSMLHVTPPMATPETLSKNKDLTNEAGFVNVHKATMQHLKYPNVYAIGDCCSCPNSKTAAAAVTMTSQIQVGFHDQRSSSRVLKPPGGGTSDIFGTERIVKELKVDQKLPEDPKPEPQKLEDSSQEDSEKPTTNGQPTEAAPENGDSSENGVNDNVEEVVKLEELKIEGKREETVSTEYKSSSISNILRQDGAVIDATIPEKKAPTPNRNRVPPGGYSSGLW